MIEKNDENGLKNGLKSEKVREIEQQIKLNLYINQLDSKVFFHLKVNYSNRTIYYLKFYLYYMENK
jgi:hypothetical protein